MTTERQPATTRDVERQRTQPARSRVAEPDGRPPVHRLQRAAGNLAIHRLLRQGGIRAKLTVNRPDDEFEREADRVADEVMRMPDPVSRPVVQRASDIVRRACRECEEVSDRTLQVKREASRMVMPYRPAGSASFGACDTSALAETTLASRKTDPWIKNIAVEFTATGTDSAGEMIPTGTLTATYASNPAKRADITSSIVGGAASDGLTDKGHHTVTRIEGCGYHHASVPKSQRITGHKRAGKYFKPSLATANATMNFAVFFVEGKSTGNQAIHEGSLSTGSLACVHVGSRSTIQQINYHSIAGVTAVDVSYDPAALTDLCCARFAAVGRMVSNPCGGQKSGKCP
jgi:hypothetical protein